MATRPDLEQFVLLPPRGAQMGTRAPDASTRAFFQSMAEHLSVGLMASSQAGIAKSNARSFSLPERPEVEMGVLDSIREDGAKLVELSPELASDLRATQPGVRLVPVVYYDLAVAPRHGFEPRLI